MRILVTGATGYVGRRLVALLLRAGHSVAALVLPEEVNALRPGKGLDVFAGDLAEHEVLAAAASGAEVVIHGAALLPGSDPEALYAVNVEGTENMLHAAARARARRFVLISSTAVYAHAPRWSWPIAEDHPFEPQITSMGYGWSKIAAEDALAEFQQRHRLEGVIVRSPPIYGPGARLAEPLLSAIWPGGTYRPQLLEADPPKQWIHVSDHARAIALAAVRNQAADHDFIVAGGETFTFGDLALLLRRILWQGAAGQLPVSRRLRYDIGRAQRVLGFQPRIGIADGFEEMAVEYLDQHESAA